MAEKASPNVLKPTDPISLSGSISPQPNFAETPFPIFESLHNNQVGPLHKKDSSLFGYVADKKSRFAKNIPPHRTEVESKDKDTAALFAFASLQHSGMFEKSKLYHNPKVRQCVQLLVIPALIPA
jgi:hypothetical protein